jgi:hypothetical protein
MGSSRPDCNPHQLARRFAFAVLELNVDDLVGAGRPRLALQLLEALVLGILVGVDLDGTEDVVRRKLAAAPHDDAGEVRRLVSVAVLELRVNDRIGAELGGLCLELREALVLGVGPRVKIEDVHDIHRARDRHVSGDEDVPRSDTRLAARRRRIRKTRRDLLVRARRQKREHGDGEQQLDSHVSPPSGGPRLTLASGARAGVKTT